MAGNLNVDRENMAGDIAEKLMSTVKDGSATESQESFLKAMEITKAYASSGSAMHYSAVSCLFYDLFEMFETGKDPRKNK
ncbi:MAG: hypothetical protein OCC45_13465 [Desulfotalea sp.]